MIFLMEEQLALYASLFRGRTDVFARRWEKNGKSGYAPAYDVDWTAFNEFRSKYRRQRQRIIVRMHLIFRFRNRINQTHPLSHRLYQVF